MIFAILVIICVWINPIPLAWQIILTVLAGLRIIEAMFEIAKETK